MIFDEFLKDGRPANPRWILADGSMQTDASRDGLYLAYCRDNRVWCEQLSDFVANPENPKLPTFERMLFLTSDGQKVGNLCID